METIVNIPTHNLGHYHIPTSCNRMTCVDVGANIGDFVMIATQLFDVVHFYEPYKPCFDIVQSKTITCNNVTGFNEAVYCLDGAYLPMISHYNRDAGSNALMTEILNDHWDAELDKAHTVSLPTILHRIGGHINYLKCDCETSEYHLLLNQDLSQIDYIGIEIHSQMGPERYYELIKHIEKTHTTTDYYKWAGDSNREVLFKNKNI